MLTAADADYPLADVLWTFVIFFGLMISFWLILLAFGDLVHRHDMSGWAKAAWTVSICLLPLIGPLTYLITQRRVMAERPTHPLHGGDQRTDDAGRPVAAAGFVDVEEIARGKALLDEGAISAEEFEQLKRRVLA
jgi:Phospholipase_D-nuclease N-terminal